MTKVWPFAIISLVMLAAWSKATRAEAPGVGCNANERISVCVDDVLLRMGSPPIGIRSKLTFRFAPEWPAQSDFHQLLQGSKTTGRPVTLYLDHIPIRGIKPLSVSEQAGLISFRLGRTPQSRDAWKELFDKSLNSPSPQIALGLGIGDEGEEVGIAAGAPVASLKIEALLERGIAGFISAAVFLVAILWLYRTLIRHQDQVALDLLQSAAILAASVAAIAFIFLVTAELPAIPASLLVLIGIPVGAGIAASTISIQKPSQSFGQLVLSGNANRAAIPRGFYFLIAVVVLMSYAYDVFEFVMLPEIDKTWLALMGVSAGAYVGGRYWLEK